MIKEDATGAAAFIHGYAALLGLGITLTRNQIVADIPEIKKMSFAGILNLEILFLNLLMCVSGLLTCIILNFGY